MPLCQTDPRPPLLTINHHAQSLVLAPAIGGSVVSWKLHQLPGSLSALSEPLNIWRAGQSNSIDAISMASMPLLPWCNRISQGGIPSAQGFYPLTPNLHGEIFPIHGDGFLQAWTLIDRHATQATLRLVSDKFLGNPQHYEAHQVFELTDQGMVQTLALKHLGKNTMAYGLGQHPWFLNDSATHVKAEVSGMWLCDPQYLPTTHTQILDPDKSLHSGMSTKGRLINNLYDGWSGSATLNYPSHGLQLTLHAEFRVCDTPKPCYLMVYRPENSAVFCLESVSHTVDAFHQQGQPGLHWLQTGESMSLKLTWRFSTPHRQTSLQPEFLNFPGNGVAPDA